MNTRAAGASPPRIFTCEIQACPDAPVAEQKSPPAAYGTARADIGDEVAAIAALRESEARYRLLADMGSSLADSLDYETTLSNAAHLAVPFLAERCFIHMLGEGSIQPAAVAHHDTELEASQRLDAQEQVIALDSDHPIARVVHSGEPVVSPDAGCGANRCNYMVVPLIAHDRTIGTISFVAAMERRYGAPDLALALAVAHRVALAIENARSYAEAQRALALRDQFLLIAAHELKTPVTTLSGHVQMAQRRLMRTYDLQERDQKSLHVMHYQADRLTQLIDALLDISRLQEGKLMVDCIPVDMREIAERIVTEVQLMLDKHSIVLKMPRAPVVVNGDALRLEQAISNLIQNAVKYSPAGGTIVVQLGRHAGKAYMRISDPGIGIPQEALPKLFDRFYRATNTTEKAIGGLGIGLYVVQEIIALHGGSIEVTSKVGQGASFRVELPLYKEAPTPSAA